jgi:hypothetical protein
VQGSGIKIVFIILPIVIGKSFGGKKNRNFSNKYTVFEYDQIKLASLCPHFVGTAGVCVIRVSFNSVEK